MHETESKSKKSAIVVIDIFTLHKIAELQVSTCNSSHKDRDDYNENDDFNAPTSAASCKTASKFPKFASWNQGKYLLVGVGAKAKSKIYYEFRVYDTGTSKIEATITRPNKSMLSAQIMSVNNHPDDEDTLVFTVKEQAVYSIVEVNIHTMKYKDVCSVAAHDIAFFEVAEDLSTIFIATKSTKRKRAAWATYEVYALDYGVSYNFTEKNKEAEIGFLGSYIQ